MAQATFQAKDLIKRHRIAVISGNIQFLYRHEQLGDAGVPGTGPGGGELLDPNAKPGEVAVPEDGVLVLDVERLDGSLGDPGFASAWIPPPLVVRAV